MSTDPRPASVAPSGVQIRSMGVRPCDAIEEGPDEIGERRHLDTPPPRQGHPRRVPLDHCLVGNPGEHPVLQAAIDGARRPALHQPAAVGAAGAGRSAGWTAASPPLPSSPEGPTSSGGDR